MSRDRFNLNNFHGGGGFQRGGFQRGGFPGGMGMGNPNFRNQNQFPFQNRGPQFGNYNQVKANQVQVQQQPQNAAQQMNRSGPTPGPALTMKGPAQQAAATPQAQTTAAQQAQKPAAPAQATAAAAQAKTQTPPPKPALSSPPPKPAVTAQPPKPAVTAQPPKPAVTAQPPKPALTSQPPKPALTSPPPKPAITSPPPKPVVTPTPAKPVVTPTPPKPAVAPTPPKPVVAAAPPKPVQQTPPPKPVVAAAPPKPVQQTPPPKPAVSSPAPPPNQMNKNQNQQRPGAGGYNQNQQKPGGGQQHNPNQQRPGPQQQQHNPNQQQRPMGGPQQHNPNQQRQGGGPQQHNQNQQRPRPGQNQNQQKPGGGHNQNQQKPEQSPAKRPEPQKRRHEAVEPTEEKETEEKTEAPTELKATLSLLLKPGEKPYTQRCRLFIGNLPNDISDEAFKKLFAKYGEPSEIFINKSKGFGFIRLESRALAEIAKAELDDVPMRGRPLRVRFATHPAALSVKNLSPYVSNELLEEAFSQFGVVERAVVIVDDRGRSSGKGIVEFASKPSARKALDRCNDGVFLLTSAPRPIVVEPLEQYDDEDGLPEKLAQKHPRYMKERDEPPRFARPGSFEFEYSKRWKSLDEMEKQQRQQVEKNIREAREKLDGEMDDAFHEHQANMLRQDLLRRQEELRRMEEMHSQEMQKRKEMQLRQEEQRRLREEEMLRQREMEEKIRLEREERYRMGSFMGNRGDMRMSASGAMDLQYGSPNKQTFPIGGMGFEGHQSLGATTGAATVSSEMRNERFTQSASFPQSARGMGANNQGFGRVREEFDGQAKKPRF